MKTLTDHVELWESVVMTELMSFTAAIRAEELKLQQAANKTEKISSK